MSRQDTLIDTARAMVRAGKGLLAMDESTDTCNKRFASAGIAQTVEMRRAYRELILTTPGLGDCLNGAILADETIRQSTLGGKRFVDVANEAGIIVGIKVDLGARPLAGFAGETVTEGLDGLRERLAEYFALGARFAKWRAVITIGQGIPSRACIETNAHALARYAALCQEAGIVPIVEPEVLMDGDHTLERCAEVTELVQRTVFEQLTLQGVLLEAMLLKPNMVVAGLRCPVQNTPAEVAAATVRCLARTTPAAVAGVAFLSGGQSETDATLRLDAMHRLPSPLSASAELSRLEGAGARATPSGSVGPTASAPRPAPWPLTFSYSRAIQNPALKLWAGKDEHRAAAQQALLHRARCNCAALTGSYEPSMERR